MKRRVFVSWFVLQTIILTCFAQKWEMKQARIMTPWSEDVNPENVLSEYPRPQLVRDNWLNLNGVWNFTKVESWKYSPTQVFHQEILVPFPMESALSGIMNTNHEENKGEVFMYQRKFTLPKSMTNQNVILHFGAVDWKSKVYVNGQLVGEHIGGFDPFSFDITHALTKKKEQEITVFVQDYQEFGGGLHGKQKISEQVIWYTPVTGIWQTVWLEGVNKTHLKKLQITPDIDKKRVNISFTSTSKQAKADLFVYDGDQLVASAYNQNVNESIDIPLKDVKLWSPENPFLYDLEVVLKTDTKEVDKVRSYFGMRKISVGQLNGQPWIMLNNKPSFHYGALDQGYWPDGLYTAPTDEALKYDMEILQKLGMNLSRKHIKIEPSRWYYHCDKMGILVWQDIPNPGFGKEGKIIGEENLDLRENFHDEMTRIVESLSNHPSIVMWVVYNESWGQPGESVSKQGVDIVRELDDTRLVSIASGWNDYEYGDIKDTHWYPQPNVLPNPHNERISVCGEYGGITLMVDGHRWLGGSDMTYTRVSSSEEFKDTFVQFSDDILNLQASGLNAAVYTQISDLEDEENGLMTYDRKVLKVSDEQVKEIKQTIEKNYTHTSKKIIPTARLKSTNTWKYLSTSEPLKDKKWTQFNFSDNEWSYGNAGFGNGGLQGANINTSWGTSHIYLRKYISFESLKTEDLDNLRIQVFHDEDCEIYINGVLAAKLDGFSNRYVFTEISEKAKQTIKLRGDNLLAVSCINTVGNQFIDLGFILTNIPLESLAYTPNDADVAFDAFHNQFFDEEKQIYHSKSDKTGIAAIWTQAIYWDMAINAYSRTKSDKYKKRVDSIYAGNKNHYAQFDWDNGKVWFIYDDIMWWIISLARAYEKYEDKAEYLELAMSGFDRVWNGSPIVKDPGSYDPKKGGMYWQWIQSNPPNRPENDGKMACINYPTVIAAMHLYNATQDKSYLDKAKEIYTWSRKNLFNVNNGMVADSKHGEGEPHWKSQLYNQGTCIGAAVMLYKETQDITYLNDALLSTDYVKNTTSTRDGILPFRTGIEQGIYVAIFAQYVAELIKELNEVDASIYLDWLDYNINTGWSNRVRDITDRNFKRTRSLRDIEVYDASGIPALMQVVSSIKNNYRK